jgi:hypothetical protein
LEFVLIAPPPSNDTLDTRSAALVGPEPIEPEQFTLFVFPFYTVHPTAYAGPEGAPLNEMVDGLFDPSYYYTGYPAIVTYGRHLYRK